MSEHLNTCSFVGYIIREEKEENKLLTLVAPKWAKISSKWAKKGEKMKHTGQIQKVIRNLPLFDRTAALFRLLGDVTNLRLFWLLNHGKEDLPSLTQHLNLTLTESRRSLQELLDAGLIQKTNQDEAWYYEVTPAVEEHHLHEMIEQLMNLTCPDNTTTSLIEEVHDYLMQHLDQHITIDDLAARFYLNTSTLKKEFKSFYGTSLAAHIKEHRLIQAAKLLQETDKSISSIAKSVGYTSQSRFSEAFKEQYHMLPKDYRKK